MNYLYARVLPLITVVIFMVYIVSCSPAEENLTHPESPESFSSRSILSGEQVNFPGDWPGEVIYLNFFMST